MKTARAKIFMSNRTQAVQLTKEVALPESVKEVEILVIGNQRFITPVRGSWDSWFDSLQVTETS